ncbi:MAG: sulfate/molybdate ABC transporter ATP-binding protein [Treponemataceae bacterium]
MSLDLVLKKSFNDFTLDLSFAVQSGEIIGLLGKSGSGKSLTLKMICGIIAPDEGSIILNQKVLFDSTDNVNLSPQKRNVGYLFQTYELFPKMSVKKNIVCGVKNKPSSKAFIDHVLKLLQIESLQNHFPHQLSGGQQQRVALARLLASQPQAILLDEPFSALDSTLKESIKAGLLQILQGFHCPIIFVSHSAHEVQSYCSRIVEIN